MQVGAHSLQLQIGMSLDKRRHVVFLAEAELHHKPSSGNQFVHGGEDPPDIAEPFGTAEERYIRLMKDGKPRRSPLEAKLDPPPLPLLAL